MFLFKQQLVNDFIENPYKDGVFTLPLQLHFFSIDNFKDIFLNSKIIAYGVSGSLKKSRNLQCVSRFLLYFENNKIIEFSSNLTMSSDKWNEYGSIVLAVHDIDEIIAHDNISIEKFNINPILIKSIQKIIIQDEKLLIDCGIVFGADENLDIMIATTFVHSVTVKAPFSTGKFDTEYYEEDFKFVPL